jgi:hypothetical protein
MPIAEHRSMNALSAATGLPKEEVTVAFRLWKVQAACLQTLLRPPLGCSNGVLLSS